MVTRAAADPDVVFLGDRVFLRNDALSCLLVKLDTSAEVLLGSKTESLTLV